MGKAISKTICLISLFCCLFEAQGQHYKLGFERNVDIEVSKNNTSFLYPWAGGMNSVFFSEIDLNLDGVPDFIAFEKHGNRILPFINAGTKNNPLFIFAPEYKYRFPKLHDWVILKDFNNDGKADIFTYNGSGGIRVFENTSNQELTFKLAKDPILSNYYGYDVNIFASTDDYLGIADITGNGKLDILNFGVFLNHVHFQKNISQSNEYFSYTLADECWGKFTETADSNEIILFTTCEKKTNTQDTRHIGSSIFVTDFNGDGLQDIVIGDVDFPGLKLLLNGGSKEEALMVSVTDDFPNAAQPVHLYSMPAVSTMNFWNEDKPDLFVSPSDPSLIKSEDIHSVWRYHYDNQLNDYVMKTKSFLQEDMIDVGSGAVPVLFDWTGNGLLDLFISNYGSFDSATYHQGVLKTYYSSSITYYKNVGTKHFPKFEWVTSDFGDLKKYGFLALYPAFADLNGDGKIDLLCGSSDGTLLYFENTAHFSQLPHFKEPIRNYQNIHAGTFHFSTPQLYDFNKDGLLDLVIGNGRGNLSYYQNMGTTNEPVFHLITSKFGNVDVSDQNFSYFGYATPYFFSYNDETLLLCGSEQGDLFLFSNIDDNLNGNFTFLEKIVETVQNKAYRINEGTRVAVAVADIDDDNRPDIFVGNWAGGITYYKGSSPLVNSITQEKWNEIVIFPNPTTGELNIIWGQEDKWTSGQVNEIEVFDIFGRKVKGEGQFPSNSLEGWMRSGRGGEEGWQPKADGVALNISHLTQGIYFVRISTDYGIITKKIVKL